MFSGIVEGVGLIKEIAHSKDIITFTIDAFQISKGVKINDSIAIDGVCLTVISTGGQKLKFNLVPQTLQKSTLGLKSEGDFVNLQRSLSVNDRIDGHFVQGHIDCTAKIINIENLGESSEMLFEIPNEFNDLIIQRGSIAIDGISLTIAECFGNQFKVAVIPHTLELTTMKDYKTGSLVNVEFDMIGKYIINTLKNYKGVQLQ